MLSASIADETHAKWINVDRVSKTYVDGRGTETLAVENVTISAEKGRIYCLLGPSGCGKSTLLNMIAGFEKPTSGAVVVGGVDVVKPGPDRAVVSQQPNLFPWKNVRQNVMYGPRLRGASSSHEQLCSRYLSAIGLQDFQERHPYELSGGMQQRVSIARALMCQPKVLLMDEPFGGLDAQTKLVMQELILSLWKDLHTTIFLITHDVDEALLLGHRVAVMSARPGRIVYEVDVELQENRDIDVTTTNEFIEQKRELLDRVREQTKRQLVGM